MFIFKYNSKKLLKIGFKSKFVSCIKKCINKKYKYQKTQFNLQNYKNNTNYILRGST